MNLYLQKKMKIEEFRSCLVHFKNFLHVDVSPLSTLLILKEHMPGFKVQMLCQADTGIQDLI